MQLFAAPAGHCIGQHGSVSLTGSGSSGGSDGGVARVEDWVFSGDAAAGDDDGWVPLGKPGSLTCFISLMLR